jgi:hypothetical protein
MIVGSLAAVVTLSSPLWWPTQVQGTNMAGFKQYPPDDFFSGQQLILAQAIRDGDLARVKELAPKTDLNTPGAKNTTLLLFAGQEVVPVKTDAANPRYRIITELVKGGARSDEPVGVDGESVVYTALRADTPNLLRALLDGGLNPNLRRDGAPIIFDATENRLLPQLRVLVEHKADVNLRDSLGKTALFDAASIRQWDAVDYLLANGANPKAVDQLGVSFAWILQKQLTDHTAPGTPDMDRIEAIRRQIVSAGVQWPPSDPNTERAAMRARGEKVIVPAGQTE